MTFISIILTILGILSSIGILAGGIGYLIAQFKTGNSKEKIDVVSSADQLVTFWKEQVEGFKVIVAELTAKLEKQKDDHNVEMKKMIDEVGQVKGQLAAETKSKSEYLAILQDKNPEIIKFREIMLKFVENQTNTNLEIMKVLQNIITIIKVV